MGLINVNAQQIIPIYPATIPGAKPTPATYIETTVTRANGTLGVSKVSLPTLTVFMAPKGIANGTAVIICPGGGYGGLAFSHEGLDVAKRFSEIGVTAFVLKYRLPSDEIMVDKTYGPMQDAQQAIYLVRKNAKKYGIEKNKIGIIGFSAGGHLAATLLTHYDDIKISGAEKISLRPDFGVLLYPVISFQDFPHAGSMRNLLGETPSDEMKAYFSANKNITNNTPPVFLVHSKDDKAVFAENSLMMSEALKANHVETEIYYYATGGHGFGLKNRTSDVDWFGLMADWLKKNKF